MITMFISAIYDHYDMQALSLEKSKLSFDIKKKVVFSIIIIYDYVILISMRFAV